MTLTARDRRFRRLVASDRLAEMVRVRLSGALVLPSLLLNGGLTVQVPLGGIAGLPAVQLAGNLQPAVALGGAPVLPSTQLSGELGLAPVELTGTLQLPSLQLAGAAPPEVTQAGTLQLPSLQLAGALTPAVALTGATVLPSTQLSGSISLNPIVVTGSLALPSLQLSGSLTMDANPISAMLDLTGATITGAGYSSVPDLLASNPAVQTVDARRPVNGTSNGEAIATYSNTTRTCLVWPSATNNNNALSTVAGFACWLRFSTYSGIFKTIIEIGGSTGAYDNSKFEIYIDSNRRVNAYYFGIDTLNYNGRSAVSAVNSVPAANTWFFLRTAFSGGKATEALRCKTYINEVDLTNTFANVGAGGNPLQLRVGSSAIPAIIGSFVDNDGTYGINGAIGPLIYLIKADLTAAQGQALMNYKRPTP